MTRNKNAEAMLGRAPVRVAFIILLAFINTTINAAPAGNLKMSIGMALEHSDNIYQNSEARTSENIYHSQFSALYEKHSPVLDANLIFNLDNANYENNALPDENRVSSGLTLISTLSKRRLFWDLNNRFDKIRSNQTLANLPTNQQNTNYFSTGPRIMIFHNAKHEFGGNVNYERFTTDGLDIDYSGYIANLDYKRNISRTFATGLLVSYNKRTFDNEIINSNYDRTDSIISFSKRMKLSRLDLEFGRTRIGFEKLDDRTQGLFRAAYQYNLGSKTDIKMKYSSELSDFSNTFARGAPGSDTYTSMSSQIFMLKSGQLSVIRNLGRTTMTTSLVYVYNDYLNNVLDETTKTGSLEFASNLTSSLSASIKGEYDYVVFDNIDRKDIVRHYVLQIRRKFSNSFDLALGISRTNQTSSNNSVDYAETRTQFGGHYYF